MDFVEAHFQQEVSNFTRLLRTQSKSLSANGVHDLRVSIRRLRVQIRLIEKSTTHHLMVHTENTLKRLSRVLGERRQCDVTLHEAQRFHLANSGLLREQKTASVKLKKVLQSDQVKNLPRELTDFEKGLRTEKIQIQPEQLKKMRGQLKAWLKRKKFSSGDLHKLRISTKKIRYTFESMDLPVEDLKELQDHLGKSHDLTVLSECFPKPKAVREADRKERQRAQKCIRPALRSSLEVLELLR
jgi:CHAD domain-containing protein